MSLYPVILCGGSGTRLWPTSRPQTPKQFAPLVQARSTFQDTVLRVADLPDLAQVVVVAGTTHIELIAEQLAQLGVEAQLLLEPAGRDSAAAMAAAAAWIAGRDAGGVAIFLAADHHLPDHAAFAQAISTGADAAKAGQIVALGVQPTAPSTAYGYIKPGEGLGPVRPIARFVEKPDAATAEDYIRDGYLWNAGNFMVRADVLLTELETFAPEVGAAAQAAVTSSAQNGSALKLGEAFLEAPRISIDYAVMEKTDRAAVLPVAFEWSDLGAWDAVRDASPQDGDGNASQGPVTLVATRGVIARTRPGQPLALVGVEDLAVIVEADGVLVARLDAAQQVKAAAERILTEPPAPAFEDLATAASAFDDWLSGVALPVWGGAGVEARHGGFHETLERGGVAPAVPRRARVQCRQAFVFARAAAAGRPGPWAATASRGWAFFNAAYRRADSLYRTRVDSAGAPLDDDAWIYDQAFALLALSALDAPANEQTPFDPRATALALLQALDARRLPQGGYLEAGPHAYSSNPHMHLLEASLAWLDRGESAFRPTAEAIVALAQERFVEAGVGLREFFDADWRPAAGEAGAWLEPGHQFEWAWLLVQWSRISGDQAAAALARELFEIGLKGVDPQRGVAINALWPNHTPREEAARLWPQTEYLKAAVALQEPEHALRAANGLWRYLRPDAPGLWRDRMDGLGRLDTAPAPASSLYHIYMAVEALGEFG
ncbi:AGE family epimerase/isomerase [Phenylobacterium sp. VNQ135]|uniref:AGE family epimerase/isomerase n=1 Tax=Phenylobacterium sp. VNQ135 TaxID=3400922 RepID=UPI003C0A4C77